ncbi:hypothetical protein ACVIIY_004012 [Bradyrhizobium sp. USDA 4515]
MNHVLPFLDGIRAQPGYPCRVLSEHVVLESPVFTDPFIGRQAALGVLKVLLAGIDEFEATEVIAGETSPPVMLRIRAGDAEVTGVDDLVDDDTPPRVLSCRTPTCCLRY